MARRTSRDAAGCREACSCRAWRCGVRGRAAMDAIDVAYFPLLWMPSLASRLFTTPAAPSPRPGVTPWLRRRRGRPSSSSSPHVAGLERMDAAGDEQGAAAERRRAGEVGPDRIADGQHAVWCRHRASGSIRPPKAPPRRSADGAFRRRRPPADRLIGIGDGAGAIDHLAAALDHEIGIGADHRHVAGAEAASMVA